ncbi:MAG: TRAP transporter substrate-binding protein [Planctomycetota bacterium]|nr:TRAP transporter substrate-binding protein [Planctomycetota bacterium]
MSRGRIRFGALAALGVFVMAAAVSAGQIKIAISHTSSLESPWNRASLLFADFINNHKELGGRYKVEVFGNGVLCQRNWKVMFEMTQANDSQIGIESATTLGSLVSEIGAINLPFLFNDTAHVTRFIEAECPSWESWFNRKILDQNLVILAAAPRPFRQINNNQKLIKTPDDIKNMIFRVPSTPLFVKIFSALGAKPVPLSSGEIYTAIQLGTVMGEDNSITVQYDFKTHEVAKNFTIWNYIADLSSFFINREVWEAMPEADRKVFLAGAHEWTLNNAKFDAEQMKEAMEKMTAAGVKFYEMSAAEKEPFKKLVQPVYDDFAQNVVGAAAMKEYLEYVEKTR